MGLKDTVRNSLLLALTAQTTFTAYSAVYVSLHTADPGNTGASEVSGGSYARVNTTTKWGTPSSGSVSSNAALQFATATGSWGTVSYAALWDASTTGNFIGGGALTASKTVASGDTASFASGNLTLSIT